jgi:hypothetical protein
MVKVWTAKAELESKIKAKQNASRLMMGFTVSKAEIIYRFGKEAQEIAIREKDAKKHISCKRCNIRYNVEWQALNLQQKDDNPLHC